MKIAVLVSRLDVNSKQIKAFSRWLMSDDDDFEIITDIENKDSKLDFGPDDFIVNYIEMKGSLAEKNKLIIDQCDKVFVFPQAFNESEDSPLWKTVRYAIMNKKPVTVFSPAGFTWELV